ncbi:hypothetical protein [Polyangium sp. 15x6]|uniref:hypothetical protein n=1 Tax=Polyangium sp. 15x6 TaxID=3042687 RepID=UPI00249A3563|nr:hypothetical protein [Polyangium sp. 15x6]MDI3282070.1 hypothetical protein [Polyangium sp. 15x6]
MRKRILFKIVAPFVVALGAASCDGDEGNTCGGPTPEERAQNQAVFDALAPSCQGCHVTGARGYFASIEAFESLVVYNSAAVVPGKPDESELIRLLEGKGTRAFKQMPIAGPPFAEIAASGSTKMTMAQIRAWVTNLESRTADPLPSIEARRITRLSAEDVGRALYQQLGLSDDDFYVAASSFDIPHKTSQNDDTYPFTSPDSIPAPYENLPVERFAALGGGSAPNQMKADGTVSPSFLGLITQLSQRWCALSLDKPGNTALLPAGASVQTGSADAASVKSVIRAWYLHFHAVDATDADIDRVFSTVFVPLEMEKDARNAYVGTCSYFIRHPDWIFY